MSRLWVYKTLDAGQSWSNRGVTDGADCDWSVGGIPQNAMDVNAEGNYLYLGVLDSSARPQILRMESDLAQDAAAVYNPGAGSEVQLMCGDYQMDKLWAAGDFGTDRVVWYDGDSYAYWYTDAQSQSWAGAARPVLVGPGDDNMCLVTLADTDKMYQSYFLSGAGPFWAEVGPALPFDVNAVARLSVDPAAMIIGTSYWYTGGQAVNYSPNNGYGWEDITDTLEGKVTALIFG